MVHTTEEWPTIIGSECVVGHNAHLEGCNVGDRCLIGSESTTLNRAVVGDGALVGAGALVPEGFKVPPGAMALGVPCKIRELSAGRVDRRRVQHYLHSARRLPGRAPPHRLAVTAPGLAATAHAGESAVLRARFFVLRG